jgi:hypothetical protein
VLIGHSLARAAPYLREKFTTKNRWGKRRQKSERNQL